MEKLINLLLGILNWYENTRVRAHDPDEIANIKVCERRVVGTFILAILFAGLSMLMAAKIPTQGDIFTLAFAPIFFYASQGFSLASLAAIISCFYFAGRGVYLYIQIGR